MQTVNPLSQTPQPPPTHTYAPIGTSIMHSPAALGCGAHPNQTLLTRMQMLSLASLFLVSLATKQSSHAIPFHIPLSHRACVGNTIAGNVTRRTHIRDHILLSHAFGTPWAIGFGKHAASCYHLDATQARQGLLKTGPRIGLGKVSGMLLEKAGFDLPQAGRQNAGKLSLARRSSISDLPRVRRTSFADLARYRAARTNKGSWSRLHRIGKWLVPVSTWWKKSRAVFCVSAYCKTYQPPFSQSIGLVVDEVDSMFCRMCSLKLGSMMTQPRWTT